MIRVQEAHLPVVADTHEGMKGKNNEDSFAVSAFQISEKDHIPVLLGVLSDGIGGHKAGEVASSIAVNVISERIAKSDGNQPVHILKDAIKQANSEIYSQSLEKERQGMGATISVVYIVDNQLYTATIGDSRIYLIRNKSIQQVSTDHTWIQEALEAGLLTPEQAIGHPNAHVIRRYLGGPKAPDIDTRLKLTGKETDAEAEANQGTIIFPGDYLLQCSDGLTDLVNESEILDIVISHPLDLAVQKLINTANERGGHDNITIIITHVPDNFEAQPHKVSSSRSSTVWLGCLGIFAFLTVILAIVWFLILRPTWQTKNASNPTAFPVNIPAVTITPTVTATELPPTVVPDTEEPPPTATIVPTEESVNITLPAPQHSEAVTSLSWSQDGTYLASASLDGLLKIWNTDNGSLTHELTGALQSDTTPVGVMSIAWNPTDSRQIASGANDGTVLMWNIDQERILLQFDTMNTAASSVAWKPDGTRLAAGFIDGTVIVWNTATGAPVRSRMGEDISIQSISWKPDGTQLALGYSDGTIKVWIIKDDEMLPDLARPSVSANRLAWSTDGKKLVSAYSDGNISVWDMNDFGSSDLYPSYHDGAIVALAWKPNHNQFASGSIDGKIVIWDASNTDSISSFQSSDIGISALAWDPDGVQLVSGCNDGRVIIWDVENGQPANNSPVLPFGDDRSTTQPGSNAPSQEQSSPGT